MPGEGGSAVGRWTRWVGVGISAALGILILFGGLGMAEHPLRRVLGWVLVGYAGVRILVNIWLARAARSSKINTL